MSTDSLVKSSTIVSALSLRPSSRRSITKSIDQTSFGPPGRCKGLALQGDALPPAALTHREARQPVEPLDPLVVGLHAFPAQQHMNPAVAKASPLVRELDQGGLDRLILGAPFGLVLEHRARELRKPAGAANRDPGCLSHRRHCRAPILRAQRFRPSAAFSASMSSIESASKRFNFAFSCSRTFRRLPSSPFTPRNLVRQP